MNFAGKPEGKILTQFRQQTCYDPKTEREVFRAAVVQQVSGEIEQTY